MKLHKQISRIFFSALMVFLLVVASMQLVDLPLAAWIADYLKAKALYAKTSAIPDLLFITVVIVTGLCWIAYFWLALRNIYDKNTFFCRVTGTALPLAYATKAVLKWIVGRMDTRTWLSDPSLYGFRWFAGTDGFQGFPSGHMLVFSTLFLAMWNYYPRFRLGYGVAWFGLGVALIATDYHFLSDVIAGAYIGALVYLAVNRSVR